MSIKAYEGFIKNGRVELTANVRLPEKTRVYVIIPVAQAERTVRAQSPRLANPEEAIDFEMEVTEDPRG